MRTLDIRLVAAVYLLLIAGTASCKRPEAEQRSTQSGIDAGSARNEDVHRDAVNTRAAAPDASARPVATSAPLVDAAARPVGELPRVTCLTKAQAEADMGISFLLRSKLSVIRVAPNDVLWLRLGPGPHEESVGKLPPDARGVTPLGEACRVDAPVWLKVTWQGQTGWANSRYLMPTTPQRDTTKEYTQHLEGQVFATPEKLVHHLRTRLERKHADQEEPPYRAKLIGLVEKTKGSATAVLDLCCEADDSVLGDQVWLDLVSVDGAWRLERARASYMCPRGTSGDLCL
jgi:hypothetical protein